MPDFDLDQQLTFDGPAPPDQNPKFRLRSAAKLLTKDEARGIVANVTKRPNGTNANGRTDVRPLGASLNETHVFVFFFAFNMAADSR